MNRNNFQTPPRKSDIISSLVQLKIFIKDLNCWMLDVMISQCNPRLPYVFNLTGVYMYSLMNAFFILIKWI